MTQKEHTPNPIDIHVGKQLRQLCTLKGVSQEQLAEAIGLTFQQVQKYMSAANRISASKLFLIAQALEVPVSRFYDDIPAAVAGGKAAPADITDDPLAKRETLELVRAYYKIRSADTRKRLFDLVKVMGREEERALGNAA